jgi:hypothetical protein
VIRIKPVDADNVFDVCDLTTNPDGVGTVMEEFLCCNAVSIAESKYYPEMHPNAIYSDSNLPESKEDGEKSLIVSCNNGDIDIEFVSQ